MHETHAEKPVELVADVITDRGEIMHLSIAYVNKLMTSQGLPSVLN